jgi:aspartyl-tRNA(Asn)/glutamyl-tRNA(Gln) amidotransferase subunit A
LEGVVPLSTKFDTVGPLTRSVEDAAELFAMMDGSKTPDLRGATLKGRRFAIVRTAMMDDLREAPKAAFENAVKCMQAVGAVVEYIDVPAVQDALNLSTILMTSQAYGQWKDVIEENPDVMYPEILKRFRLGAGHSAADYVAAVNRLEEVRKAYNVAMSGYDALLAPTSAIMPPNLDRLNTEEDYYVTENLLSLRNTRVGNLLGLCGLTLPTGVPSCGIMFLCAPDTEAQMLRIGVAAEAALS